MFVNIDEIKFYNPGVLIATLDKNIFEQLQDDVKTQILNVKRNDLQSTTKTLAGQIAEEYEFNVNLDFVLATEHLVKEYCNKYYYSSDIEIDSIRYWINLQKRTEYNPVHDHTGDLSFVIWTNIPFSCKEEDQLPNSIKSNKPLNGRFGLAYNTLFGHMEMHYLEADKNYEGKMLMFPAKAKHVVYPFYTSDDYRISIAGNITLKKLAN